MNISSVTTGVLLQKLRTIFRDIFDDESMSISEGTSRDELDEWDSVAHVKIVLSVEDEFDIRLTMDDVTSIKTVGDFIQAIVRHTEG